MNDAIKVAQAKGYVGEGDTVVLTAGVVGNVRNATNLLMVRRIDRVLARGTASASARWRAGFSSCADPWSDDEEVLVGPQHIIFADRIDRSCIKILRRAGGFITVQGGMDSPGAILAPSNWVCPAVIGIEGNLDELVDGLSVVLDANTGQVSEWKK